MKHCNKYFGLILIVSVMLLFNGCDKVRFRVYKDNEETNVGIENDEDNNDISDKKMTVRMMLTIMI
jgi:hypothetical protein